MGVEEGQAGRWSSPVAQNQGTARTGASQSGEVDKPWECPLSDSFICVALRSKSILCTSMACCLTGPKLCGILDSANHSGWPCGILSLIAWGWAYCSDSTPIKQINHPVSAIQTVWFPAPRMCCFVRFPLRHSVVLVCCQLPHWGLCILKTTGLL